MPLERSEVCLEPLWVSLTEGLVGDSKDFDLILCGVESNQKF